MGLPGAEKYRREPEEPRKRRGGGLEAIDRANEVPITSVMRDMFGSSVPDEIESSWKVRCPFGFEHSDGGIDSNFRVYPTNTAYCFAMHGGLTPIRLVMMSRDVNAVMAAKILAERYGLVTEREPYWDKMSRLVLEAGTEGQARGSSAFAVEAMQLALDRVPGYVEAQFEERVLTVVEDRLEVLDGAMRSRTEGAVREWLRETVRIVRETL